MPLSIESDYSSHGYQSCALNLFDIPSFDTNYLFTLIDHLNKLNWL